jgi:acetate kinase
VESQLRDLTDLAPLHQPKSLAALDAVSGLFPGVPAVACFDTAFHATIPAAAATYAIPREWRTRYGIRRYGFHGLSHAYCSQRAAQLVGRPLAGSRIVTAHLGAGASLAAVRDGRSVDTTMGFTPLEGLVMATRSGSVDPGLVLWLEEHEHLAPQEVAAALEHRSGLLALTGSADMRAVEAAVERGAPDAQLGLDVYVHRLVAGIAAMTAALGGIDVLAFTGGIGEHSPRLRRLAVDRLGYLGLAVGAGNDDVHGDMDASTVDAPVRTVVVAAREDLQIARETRDVLEPDRVA